MEELIKGGHGGLIGLLHGQGGDIAIPKPFEREIFLFDTHAAGTFHIDGVMELEPYMKIDDKLDYFREPSNEYDSKAIAIRNAEGIKIGNVPRLDNAIFPVLWMRGSCCTGAFPRRKCAGHGSRLISKYICMNK